jgi:hypothetical protein
VNGVHDFFHGTDGVSVFQQVLGERGFVISVFEVTKVFLKAGAEQSAGLFCVFHITCGAGNLVYSGFVIFVLVGVVFFRE